MVAVSHLQKKYGKQTVLKDVSFEVHSGEWIAIAGRNGCGKSTLLQILAGILRPDGGSVQYYGKPASAAVIRRYVGYVPQENPLLEELSVWDNLHLWDLKKESHLEAAAQQFGLDGLYKKRVRDLSGGMKRRLSLACAWMGFPPVLLLDEPTTALDLYYKESIQHWIREFVEGNGIVIMTSHDETELKQAHRCLWMEDGQINEIGNYEIGKWRERYGNEFRPDDGEANQ